MRILAELLTDKEKFIAALKESIDAEISDELLLEIAAIDADIAALQEEALKINKENRSGALSNLDYDAAIAAMEVKLSHFNKERDEKVLKSEQIRVLAFRIGDIERLLGECEKLDEFDEFIFKDMVDSAIIAGKKATFIFKFGMEFVAELK